ncbi:MAG TPA: GC-type dockerin domain-anchored protein [Sedimentisphaerales bacterium]|nr:GC-type dockerin domain-anchored protein [Sedimentisphaerales bacterium]
MIANPDRKSRAQSLGVMLLLAVLACVVLTNAYAAKADFIFGTPTNLGPTINGPDDLLGACISYDRLALYFCSDRPGGYGGYDLWMTTRPTIDDDWREPVNLGPNVNSQYDCMAPSISADGLTLYFSDYDYGKYPASSVDIWMVTRETKDAAWSAPVNVGQPVNWEGGDNSPNISADGLSLYFASSGRRGDPGAPAWYDLWVATRTTTNDEWGAPENLGPTVNSQLIDSCPSISADGLLLYFMSDRAGGQGDFDIWMTSRVTEEHDWSPPVNLGPVVNSSAKDLFPSISVNGSTLYFCSSRPGGYGGFYGDIWQVSIEPVVDFNSDGNIDTDDLLILIGYWGQNEPLCDIGPTPFGDGIVDIKDLEVFMSYWEKENMPEAPEEEL